MKFDKETAIYFLASWWILGLIVLPLFNLFLFMARAILGIVNLILLWGVLSLAGTIIVGFIPELEEKYSLHKLWRRKR